MTTAAITPKLYRYVDRITDEHIETFVQNFMEDSSGELAEAITLSEIMKPPDVHPDNCEGVLCEHIDAMVNDENEILNRVPEMHRAGAPRGVPQVGGRGARDRRL